MLESQNLEALMKGPLPDLLFCIGDPVVGNPTQYMLEAAFEKLGYTGRYLTCQLKKQELAPALWGFRALAFKGGNVTAPYKQKVFEFLDELTESANLCQAVNCITRKDDGTYIGDNTDGKGFLQALKQQIGSVEHKTIIILGAGGAASAIATELVLAKAGNVTIVNRTEERAKQIVKRLDNITSTKISAQLWEDTYMVPEDADVVVQATSVGLFSPDACVDVQFPKHETPRNACDDLTIPKQIRQVYACDVVFNPVDTKFLKMARNAGYVTIDGLGMLVNQGAIALEGWTGKEPDREVMRSALQKAFSVL